MPNSEMIWLLITVHVIAPRCRALYINMRKNMSTRYAYIMLKAEHQITNNLRQET